MRVNAAWMWVWSVLLPVGFPVMSIIYGIQAWDDAARTNSVDRERIGMEILASVLLTFVTLPITLGIAWFCLRRFSDETRWLAWRGDRPVRTVLATFVFGGAALYVAALTVSMIKTGWPWYEYLPPAYFAIWPFWLLGLRAALIEQVPVGEWVVGGYR